MADRTIPADFAASAVLGATQLNELTRGEAANDKLTSNSSTTASTTVVMSETFTTTDDRRFLFLATTTARTDIAGGIQFRLDLDGTQIQRKNIDLYFAGVDLFITLFTVKNVAAGEHTIEAIIGVSGSSGNQVTAIANGATGTHGIGELSVIELGPQYS